jgi:glycosyltransferase involved in cell wall biosynthesis
MAARLSLTMIVRDEERTLGRVLKQAAGFCDEMVVVDTGSTDDTPRIAERAGAQVLDFAWRDDFAAARNHSLAACRGDWIVWLDADDVITPEAQAAFAAVKKDLLDDSLDSINAPYHYAVDANTGQCTYTFPRERLARRVPGLHWTGAIHEILAIPGDRAPHRGDLVVEHHPDPARRTVKSERNLRIIEREWRSGNRSRRTRFYYACELRDAGQDAAALERYAEYLEDPGSDWEKYAALLSMSACCRRLGRTGAHVDQLHAAIRLAPSRAEAFVALGQFYFDRGEWADAMPFFAAAAALRAPGTGFVSVPDYTWRPWDYLSVCLGRLGRHEESIAAALHSANAGNPDRSRLRSNVHWSVDGWF